MSHSQLLFRSDPEEDRSGTTIDVLFKPVEVLKIRQSYRGLTIRNATDEEAYRIKASTPSIPVDDERVFLLESQGEADYVISSAMGWREDVLSRTRQSLFASADSDMPRWPTQPLDGFQPGLNVASIQELMQVMETEEQQVRRQRYRTVYVLMTRVDRRGEPDIGGAGVFITEADAEDARAFIAPKVADCWIEPLPIAI
ncbi:hypothetical protein [Microbispora sp. NPDC049125]|uniref:hypothetical protein n=1 Tax=Microbispora sp. NPDC049125 TaxID=3154929 RepID=UPI003466C000